MTSVADADPTPFSRAFTVIIPCGLRGSVDGLPPQTRQALLSELFRMASRAHQEHGLPSRVTCVDLEGCHATVEVDPSRSRLTLAGLTRIRALG